MNKEELTIKMGELFVKNIPDLISVRNIHTHGDLFDYIIPRGYNRDNKYKIKVIYSNLKYVYMLLERDLSELEEIEKEVSKIREEYVNVNKLELMVIRSLC